MLRPRFHDRIKSARAKGYTLGRNHISQWLGATFTTTSEWLAFRDGWRRGDREYQRLVIEAKRWAA
ncbi:MAG: hypothetical protein ABFD89_00995 [Bryobacteraceae bacterium]